MAVPQCSSPVFSIAGARARNLSQSAGVASSILILSSEDLFNIIHIVFVNYVRNSVRLAYLSEILFL